MDESGRRPQQLWEQAEKIVEARPSLPLWLLGKLIWLSYKGKQMKVKLSAPYEIQYTN